MVGNDSRALDISIARDKLEKGTTNRIKSKFMTNYSTNHCHADMYPSNQKPTYIGAFSLGLTSMNNPKTDH